MSEDSEEGSVKKIGLVPGLIALPVKILPKWYFGITALGGFAAVIAPYYITVAKIPLWLAFLPLYAPFVPSAIAIAGILLGLLVLLIFTALLSAFVGIATLIQHVFKKRRHPRSFAKNLH